MQQLDMIYQARPNTAYVSLQFLNIRDITMMVPKIALFKYMDTLSLHGNKLTFLPTLQSLLELKELDITHNPIKIDNNLMDSLFSIPKLQSLLIDFKNQEQKDLVLQNLPKLKYLNHREIQRKKVQVIPRHQQMMIIKEKLTQQQNNARNLLNNVYSMLDENNAPPDATEDFNFNLKVILQQFDYFYQNINSSLAKQCVYLYYKNRIYQVIDTHLSTFLQDNGYQNVATAIQQINKSKKQNFQDILKVALSYAYHEDFSKKTVQQGNKLRKQTLYQNQITRLKKKVAQLSKQNQQIQKVNQRYLQKIYHNSKSVKLGRQKSGSNLSRLNDSFQNGPNKKILTVSRNTSNLTTPVSKQSNKNIKQIRFQYKQGKEFKKHNQQEFDDFDNNAFKKTGNNKNYDRSPAIQRQTPKKRQFHQIEKSPSYRVLPSKSKQAQKYPNFQKTKSMGSLSLNKLKHTPSSKSISRNKNSYNNQEEIKRSTSKQTLHSTDKKITLDQFVQFIDDFIYQKGKFNIQCLAKNQLFQTPQQFLFTYFLRKYGLRDLAVEWSILIIKAIQKFSKQNVIVQIFGKILKNTLQEQFYQKCKDFKDYIGGNVPLKDRFQINEVQHIFYKTFSDAYRQDFEKFITQKIDNQNVKGEKFYFRRSLIYNIQQFYVKKHEKQIQKYLNSFKSHDSDDDGIIQNEQIQKCIMSFIKKHSEAFSTYEYEQNVQKLYNQIINKRRKKANLVSMTFSQFVSIMRQYI